MFDGGLPSPAVIKERSMPILPTRARALFLYPLRNRKKPGNFLLSHQAALAVPSAPEGLTSVFGMGTGVTPPL
jgi:hypothetical protein